MYYEIVVNTNPVYNCKIHSRGSRDTHVTPKSRNEKKMSRSIRCVPAHSNNFFFSLICISKQPLNLKPDWGVIWGMTVFMLVCIIMLVIAVIIWRPKSIERYSVRALRPKYTALGAPVPVVPIPGEMNTCEIHDHCF